MTNSTHTPGPWDFHGPYMAGAYKVTALAPAGGVTLRIYVDHVDTFDTESNARLIAAAPDLLAALESVLTGDGAKCLAYGTDTPAMRRRFSEINRIASEAIRKAKGE